jgi:hypothetical protein
MRGFNPIPSGSPVPRGGLGIDFQLKKTMFFDRSRVINALSKSEFRFVSRASLLVRRNAQRSIKKMGNARPPLAIAKANPGLSLDQLSKLPGVSKERGSTSRDSKGRFLPGSGQIRSRAGVISERDRAKVLERIREVKERPPSPPGSPPHTHVSFDHMLGFRRNLYNAFDTSTRSGLAGPFMRGEQNLPRLHEFGGSMMLACYVWRPKWQPYNKPIIRWMSPLTNAGPNWIPIGKTRSVSMPRRPFMRPALEKSRTKFAQIYRDAFGP